MDSSILLEAYWGSCNSNIRYIAVILEANRHAPWCWITIILSHNCHKQATAEAGRDQTRSLATHDEDRFNSGHQIHLHFKQHSSEPAKLAKLSNCSPISIPRDNLSSQIEHQPCLVACFLPSTSLDLALLAQRRSIVAVLEAHLLQEGWSSSTGNLVVIFMTL